MHTHKHTFQLFDKTINNPWVCQIGARQHPPERRKMHKMHLDSKLCVCSSDQPGLYVASGGAHCGLHKQLAGFYVCTVHRVLCNRTCKEGAGEREARPSTQLSVTAPRGPLRCGICECVCVRPSVLCTLFRTFHCTSHTPVTGFPGSDCGIDGICCVSVYIGFAV